MSKTLPITKYRKYDAFQALYEVYSLEGVDIDPATRYALTILRVTEWLRKRYDVEMPFEDAAIVSIRAYLKQYPPADDYASFDITGIEDFDTAEVEDIHICSYSNDEDVHEWALQLSEAGKGNTVSLITDVSIRHEGSHVYLAVRGSKKIRADAEDEGTFYRPAFIRSICLWDDRINLVEAGLDIKYGYTRYSVHVNGKSDSELSGFITNLLDNPNRQLPVYLLTEDTMNSMGSDSGYKPQDTQDDAKTEETEGSQDESKKDERLIVDAMAQAVLGYATVVVMDRSARKLFSHKGYEEYVDILEQGNIIRRDISSDTDAYNVIVPEDFKTYFALDDENRMTGSIIPEVRSLMEHRRHDYRNARFYREIHVTKREDELRLLFSGADYDPGKLQSIIEEQQVQYDELQNELAQEKEERLKEYESKQREIERLNKEVLKLRNYTGSLNERLTESKAETSSLSDKLQSIEQETANTVTSDSGILRDDYLRMHRAIYNVPIRKEGICDWIRNDYADTLVLTDRAEDSLIKDNRNIDLNTLTHMIHCLHAYTLARNEGLLPEETEKMISEYSVENEHFDIGSVGDPVSSSTTTPKEIQKKYDLTISAADGRSKTVKMNLHVKKGTHPETLIRIYFYYDPDQKKSFIGYMPDHLPLTRI